MAAVELADAQERLKKLIDRVADGETVEIVSDGRTVAMLAPPKPLSGRGEPADKKQPIVFDRRKALRALMPEQKEDAGTFMRRLRDDERY
jgi:prevent-host-death family protein